MRYIKQVIKFVFVGKVRVRFYVNWLIKLKKKNRLKLIRLIIQEHLRNKYHVLISEKPSIGSLILPHPHNVVIGGYATIGENCTLYHDVTIGQNMDQFPSLGDNVIVYPGAKIIGGIDVGDNAIIGANAVVTSDVPDNAIVGGIPATIIRYRSAEDKFY